MELPDDLYFRLVSASEQSLAYFQVCTAMGRSNFPANKDSPPLPPPELVLQVELEEILGKVEAKGYIHNREADSIIS